LGLEVGVRDTARDRVMVMVRDTVRVRDTVKDRVMVMVRDIVKLKFRVRIRETRCNYPNC
jgi:hypothetical protein